MAPAELPCNSSQPIKAYDIQFLCWLIWNRRVTDGLDSINIFHPSLWYIVASLMFIFMIYALIFLLFRSTEKGKEDIAPCTSNNSTQTPSDMSPLPIPIGDEPTTHHQNPKHCISSFASINKMRQNAQVGCFLKIFWWVFKTLVASWHFVLYTSVNSYYDIKCIIRHIHSRKNSNLGQCISFPRSY